MIGPHVFGDNRMGIWIINNQNLTDKLKHVLPRLRKAVPFLTDVFLPEEATVLQRSLVRDNNFFSHLYTIPHGRGPNAYADQSAAAHTRLGGGALELNVEIPDDQIRNYVAETVVRLRKTKPKLPVRINIAPFKARYLPVSMIEADPNLYVIEQAYFGNMDGRASEADCLLDLIENGVPVDKSSIMYGVLNGNPRVNSLPSGIRRWQRGSIYSDDLMLDAGLLPS